MIRFLKYAIGFGAPFALFTGIFGAYAGDRALRAAVVSGVLFGTLMAAWLMWYLRRHRLRLEARGIEASNMRPRQSREIELSLPPQQALKRCADAIRALPRSRAVVVDAQAGTIAARMAMTFRSFGERLVVTVLPAGGGSLVRIESAPVIPTTVFDYGKGLENVETVRGALVQMRA
jgi:hypothetical protein